MYTIILCGGSGTRLWPLSRKNFPKQFLKLYNDYSLLQETFLRINKIIPTENIFFVTNELNFFNVLNQIRELDKNFSQDNILKEPEGRNTAPAIAYAIKHLKDKLKVDDNTPIITLHSDHYIKDVDEYLKVVERALNNVEDHIGTIGITPTKPETGYGYILKNFKFQISNSTRHTPGVRRMPDKQGKFYKVQEFKEKPDVETAKKYLASGEYVWNSGMYVFKLGIFWKEMKKHAPEIYSFLEKSLEEFVNEFNQIPALAIDVALSERSDNLIVFEGNFGWSDVGSFDSLADLLETPQSYAAGQAQDFKPEVRDTKNNYVNINSKNIFTHSTHDRLIVASDVEDLIVVDNNDAILIQKKGKSENVKKVVEYLKKNNYDQVEDSIIVHRPWGKYEVLIDAKDHKVKKITVSPGAKLSLQSHNRRTEHWVVVKGEAKVTNGDNIITLQENESTFIPKETKHRLENVTQKDLEIIEVQTGDYLEEDDIVRYDDIYSR